MAKYDVLIGESPWIKYLLGILHVSKGGRIEGSLRLHNELFLISRGIPELLEDDSYGPHDYGPFSEEMEEDIIGLLEVEGLLNVARKNEYESATIYDLTSEGRIVAKDAYDKLDENAKLTIQRVNELISDLTSDEILFIIYSMYPKMAKYSKVYDEIIRKKVKLAASIYKKNKMSLKQLSELAQVDEKIILDARM